MCRDCEQALVVHPDQYEKFRAFYDGLDDAARKLHENGTKVELDAILEAVVYYFAPATAKVLRMKLPQRW